MEPLVPDIRATEDMNISPQDLKCDEHNGIHERSVALLRFTTDKAKELVDTIKETLEQIGDKLHMQHVPSSLKLKGTLEGAKRKAEAAETNLVSMVEQKEEPSREKSALENNNSQMYLYSPKASVDISKDYNKSKENGSRDNGPNAQHADYSPIMAKDFAGKEENSAVRTLKSKI